MKFLGKIGFVVLLLVVLCKKDYAQLSGNFELFSVEDGLSHAYINVLFLDSRGFIWIGTKNGLNRYDGYNFNLFRQQPGDSTSISNNHIRCIAEDSKGKIWIGTDKGLNRFDHKTGKFTRFYINTEKLADNTNNIIYHILVDNNKIWLKTIESIIELNDSLLTYKTYKHFYNPYNYSTETNQAYLLKDHKNIFWIGSKDGLNAFDPATKKFMHYSKRYNNLHSLSNNEVNAIIQDDEKRLWIGTKNGLNLFVDSSHLFKRFLYEKEKEGKTNEIFSMYHEGDTLWLGANNGIFKFNTKTFDHVSYNSISSNKGSIELGNITAIIKDRSDIYWLGTNRGLIKYNFRKEKFKPLDSKLNVTSILETADSLLWIGTKSKGLKMVNLKDNAETWYRFPAKLIKNQGISNYIAALYEDIHKNLWVGTGNGIHIIDSNKVAINIQNLYPDIPATFLLQNTANTFLEDPVQQLWIGTDKGLLIINRILNTHNIITEVIQDSTLYKVIHIHSLLNMNNKILIGGGTGEGYVMSVTGESPEAYKFRNIPVSDFGSELSYLTINDLEYGNDDLYWVASSVGLKRISISTGEIEVYGEQENLPSNNILGIIPVRNDLWLSTSDGIARFNTNTHEVVPYSVNDGLQNYEFNRSAIYKNTSGKLYFGGITGYNSFHPDSLVKNQKIPPVAISKIQLSTSQGMTVLEIDKKNKIVIPHGNNIVNINFSALDFNWPIKNKYKYKLTPEGTNTDWINLENQHNVSFANMKPGTYIFEVIGSNSDGIWNEEGAGVIIVVSPPLSRTGMAYLFYVVFILIILYLIYNYRTWQLRKANEEYKERERVNFQIAKQKEELSIKNKNITDSINYAKRIQLAMLPSSKMFKKILPNSFIFYRPKDIVSGDFYWIKESSNKIYVAAVDCTGHGVPGAFMSIIGIELLRKIINTQKFENPSKVLNVLNQDFAEIFKDVENITLRDGMDIAFCTIDKKTLLLEFAGAFNPLYVIRDNTITEIKGERFSVGIDENDEDEQVFKNHVIQLEENDMIYIFTDGYADQFGGPEGKKYKYRRFRHLLLTIHTLPLEIQKELLNASIKEWKGNLDQVDDILVIGIKPRF